MTPTKTGWYWARHRGPSHGSQEVVYVSMCGSFESRMYRVYTVGSDRPARVSDYEFLSGSLECPPAQEDAAEKPEAEPYREALAALSIATRLERGLETLGVDVERRCAAIEHEIGSLKARDAHIPAQIDALKRETRDLWSSWGKLWLRVAEFREALTEVQEAQAAGITVDASRDPSTDVFTRGTR